MKTQGEIEAAICEGISRFEQEYRGRGPKDIHAFLLGDFVVVRLKAPKDRFTSHDSTWAWYSRHSSRLSRQEFLGDRAQALAHHLVSLEVAECLGQALGQGTDAAA